MIQSGLGSVANLIADQLGAARATTTLRMLAIDTEIGAGSTIVDRSSFAMALNILLLEDLLNRSPSGASYVAERVAAGGTMLFDHGALRTIRFADGPTGDLLHGAAAFARILEPLGYVKAKTYPLPALRMTGYAYRQVDFPETIPQFFVSELHVEQFSEAFADAARHVFGTSKDPLAGAAIEALDAFAAGREIDAALAAKALPIVVSAFDRQHAEPRLADYETLLRESREAAWIATEGNAFNHATDRVDDVIGLADALRSAGKAIKDKIEYSANGRVRQTALRADLMTRYFLDRDGRRVSRSVPGSFFEFISRDIDQATGTLDLSFDSGNAQGIFTMTRAA